jgi:hypothetical protein
MVRTVELWLLLLWLMVSSRGVIDEAGTMGRIGRYSNCGKVRVDAVMELRSL